jgi:arylsulfatase A-like enzyme
MISALAAVVLPAPIAKKPNIVLIFSDDAGYADFGFSGSLEIKTPNIDRIANEGVNFTDGYVSAPVCSPSRAGLLTGKNPQRFGHEYNIGTKMPGYDPRYRGLNIKEKTIGDRLQEQGYVTGLLGKWHLGEEEQFHPQNRGFDEFYGLLGGSRDFFKPQTGSRKLISNFKDPEPVTYFTDDLGRESLEFITRHKDEPFFLFLSHTAPHTPLQAKPEDLELYKYLPNARRQILASMLHALDVQTGLLLDHLKALELEENTLVVFMNDNGGQYDWGALNAPYRGMKGTVLEGGVRVPFAMRWPGRIEPGTTCSTPVVAHDLAQTFVTAAGGAVPENETDGVDILDVIQNPAPYADRSLFWRFQGQAAVRKAQWKLVRFTDRPAQLYDLSADPSELNDLASLRPERVRAMMKEIGNWELDLAHPLFVTEPIWKKVNLSHYDREYQLTQPKK